MVKHIAIITFPPSPWAERRSLAPAAVAPGSGGVGKK